MSWKETQEESKSPLYLGQLRTVWTRHDGVTVYEPWWCYSARSWCVNVPHLVSSAAWTARVYWKRPSPRRYGSAESAMKWADKNMKPLQEV